MAYSIDRRTIEAAHIRALCARMRDEAARVMPGATILQCMACARVAPLDVSQQCCGQEMERVTLEGAKGP